MTDFFIRIFFNDSVGLGVLTKTPAVKVHHGGSKALNLTEEHIGQFLGHSAIHAAGEDFAHIATFTHTSISFKKRQAFLFTVGQRIADRGNDHGTADILWVDLAG